MRWLFSLLLLANAVYFVWQNSLESENAATGVVSEGVAGLRLLREIDASLLLLRGRDESIVETNSLAIFAEDGLLKSGSLGSQSAEATVNLSAATEELSALQGVTLKTGLSDQPVTNQPVQDQPIAEQSVQEQSVTEQSVTEQPVTEQSVTEQSVTEQSVTEQSVTEQPVTEQSVTERSVQEQPVTDQSVTDQSTVDRPVEDKAFAGQWCQVVSGLSDDNAQKLLEALEKAGLAAEIKVSDMETVQAFELIMDKPIADGENAALITRLDRLDIKPQELLLNGETVYVLERFGSRNEMAEALSRLPEELAPRIYQVVSKGSYSEVWVALDGGTETSNKIKLLASVFLPGIKNEKKSCKGVASAEGRD